MQYQLYITTFSAKKRTAEAKSAFELRVNSINLSFVTCTLTVQVGGKLFDDVVCKFIHTFLISKNESEAVLINVCHPKGIYSDDRVALTISARINRSKACVRFAQIAFTGAGSSGLVGLEKMTKYRCEACSLVHCEKCK